jgi:hypothetical protein
LSARFISRCRTANYQFYWKPEFVKPHGKIDDLIEPLIHSEVAQVPEYQLGGSGPERDIEERLIDENRIADN